MKKDELNSTLTYVNDRFLAADNARDERRTAWNKSYQYYRGNNNDSEDEYFIPETYTSVETILPRLVSDFLNTRKSIVSVEGRNIEDHGKAEVVEALLGYSFQRDNLGIKLVDFYRQALIYGTAVGKVYWDYKPTTKKQLQMAQDEFGSIEYFHAETHYLEKDDPCFEVIPIYDFYVDPAATSIADARYCVQRKLMTRKEIEELADLGVFDKDAVEELPEEGAGEEESGKRLDRSYSNFTTDEISGGIPGKFEILEYWEDDRVIVVAERRYVLRDEENPYWHRKKPFVAATFSPLPFEFYGQGVPEVMEDLQKILNDLANSRLQNIKLVVNRMWLMAIGAVDKRDLVSKPGGIIPVNSQEFDKAIRPLPTPDVTSSAYNEQEIIQQAIQNATGASDYVRGNASDISPNQTATEVMKKTEMASSRFAFVFRLMADQSIKEIARLFMSLLQQYMTEEKSIKILDKRVVEFRTITPIDIQGEFDFVPSVDPTHADEQERRDNLMQFYGLTTQNPMLTQMINFRKIVEEIAESLDIDAEALLNPEEQIQQEGQYGQQPGLPGAGAQDGGGVGNMQGMETPFGAVPPPTGGFGNFGFDGMPPGSSGV